MHILLVGQCSGWWGYAPHVPRHTRLEISERPNQELR